MRGRLKTDRISRLIWAGLVLCGLLFALTRVTQFLNPTDSTLVDRDFSNLWVGGKLALGGQAGAIYDLAAFRAATIDIAGAHFLNNYSYPPHSLFLAIPFGAMPYWLALVLWDVGSLIVFYLAARPIIPKDLPWWVVVFSPASLICLTYGHYGLLCGALWLCSFRGNGWAAAMLTIKPHIGLLVAVQLLIERRALPTAIAGTVALVSLSVATFGMEPWRDWLTTTLGYQVSLLDGHRPLMHYSSVSPMLAYGLSGQILFALAATILLSREFNVFTAATATFLIVPYGFHYDLTVVCFGFAAFLATRWSDLPLWQKAAAMIGFLTPALVSFGTWIAPPILLLGLYVQTAKKSLSA